MKWPILGAVLVVAPLAFQAQTVTAKPHDTKREITLHGCVIPAEKKGTFLMTNVMEIPAPGTQAMPEMAHGRRVVYWLKDLKDMRQYAGRMVEVRGTLNKFKKSEIELKAGPQKNGELYVEFEGPGKNVKVPQHEVGNSVGTAGRVVPEKDDIKTMLAVIDVKNVTGLSDSCQ